MLQIAYSIWKRKELPTPLATHGMAERSSGRYLHRLRQYNFAVLPTVSRIDDWWYQKKDGVKPVTEYEDIVLPKSSGKGFAIGMTALVFGGALIWHVWWLVALSAIVIVGLVIRRTMDDFTEYVLPKTEVARLEQEARA